MTQHARLTWTARLTILLALGLIYAAGADGGQQRCQQRPALHTGLKP
jgi:hypothetical protein